MLDLSHGSLRNKQPNPNKHGHPTQHNIDTMMRGPLIAGLLNLVALSALFLGNIGWKCEKGYHEAARKYMTDAPLEFSHPVANDNDGQIGTRIDKTY